MVRTEIDRLMDIAYDKYCGGDSPCYFASCPVNAVMLNFSKHIDEKSIMLLYGDFKVLERLGEKST